MNYETFGQLIEAYLAIPSCYYQESWYLDLEQQIKDTAHTELSNLMSGPADEELVCQFANFIDFLEGFEIDEFRDVLAVARQYQPYITQTDVDDYIIESSALVAYQYSPDLEGYWL